MTQKRIPKLFEDNKVKEYDLGYIKGRKDAVRRYIEEQQGKEVFEYSVFGSPNQKIGDFTQAKIGDFN